MATDKEGGMTLWANDQDGKPLLLLVDDVSANLQLLAAMLKDEYRLRTATSGKSALELLERDDLPELVLLDLMMPDISGIEVLRTMRQQARTRDVPVIIITADTTEQNQLEGLMQGAEDYLTKPVSAPILRARIKNLLARRRSERALRLSAHVFEHSGEAILICDRDNHIVAVNAAFERLTGYTFAEVRGKNPKLLASGRTTKEEYRTMWRTLLSEGVWQGELWDRHKDGHTYPKMTTISTVKNHEGKIDYFIANFADISAQKQAEERIRRLALFDALTGLSNRLHLSILFEQILATVQREKRQLAVIFLDLDRFKLINDTLGHRVGDLLLVEVAQRIKWSLRSSDLAARLGGDEFVIVIAADHAPAAAASVAGKLLRSLGAPYELAGHIVHSSPSIGIALYPADGSDVETLMKNADTAMYHAKQSGRNNAQFYTEAMNLAARERIELENALRRALEQREFVLHYQPQVCAGSERICGVEALLRWQHPEKGLIAPALFIPVAEETGLIEAIGEWVIDEACRQAAAWKAAGIRGVVVAVNLSAQQLKNDSLVPRVRATLERHGLEKGEIEFEVTETTAMTDPERAIERLTALRALGIRLSIDDFGTGYSSLFQLKRLPLDALKLDRAFVSGIEKNQNDAVICATTIAMARSLGLHVIAEGVETKAQRDFLTAKHRCDLLQGYLFGKPEPAEAITARLLQQSESASCRLA